MKKITLFLFMMFTSFLGYSQLFEDFEGTSLPNAATGVWSLSTTAAQYPGTSWRVENDNINGLPSAQTWGVNTVPANVYAGTRAAFLQREGAGPGLLAVDRLITPSVNVPNNGQLRFWTRQTLAGNQGSTYTIRISTTSQTGPFTTIQTWTETEMNAVYDVYEEKIVSIPAIYHNQQVFIAFVMTNNNGDRWLVDNVNLVEQCLNPTNLTASGPTLTTSNLGWGNPSGATQWEVEIVPTGATPTGTGVVATTNPYTATGLTEGTCYDYYVRASCATGTTSEWVGPFNFCTVALGATCSVPIPITGTPFTTTDNTSDYGDDVGGIPGAAATCGTGGQYLTGDDVFYAFTSTTGIPVTVTSQTTTNFSGLFVYNSCANVGVSCVAGSTAGNGSTTPDNLIFTPIIGVTYYIVVSTWASPQPQSTPYTLTIVENSCTNMTANFALVSNCGSTTAPNTFFVTANVSNMGTATSISGTTTPASTTETITAAGLMQFGPFPNNTPVTINLINNQDANCFRNSAIFNQTFCPAPNNLCVNAIPVTCGSTFSDTTQGATTAGAPTTACGTTAGSGGVWYTYAGNGDVVTFSLCGSTFDTKIQVYTGSCGAFNCVTGNDNFAPCGTQSQVQITTAPGTLYYIYVFGTGTAQGAFTLNTTCITPPPPPANDNCDTATIVTVNTDNTCTLTTPGTVVGATPSTQANACVGAADDDVWFSFTATQSIHTVDILNVAGSSLDLNHAVYTSTSAANPCGNLTQIICSNPDFSFLTGLVAGQVYYIRVYTAVATPLQTTTFDVCVSVPPPPPANDECNTATNVVVNTDGTCNQVTQGTVVGATQSAQANACVGSADDDVWFSFTATQATHTLTIQNVQGSTLDLNHVVYTSTNTTNPCGNLTQVICTNPDFSFLTGLVAGQTYFIRVYTAVATPLQTTTFTVCISVPPPPPTNDSCANPIIVPVNAANACTLFTPGAITSATASPEPNACGGTANDDVWFQFTATNTTHIISLNNILGTTTDLNFVVYSGTSCGSLTQVACNLPNSGTITGLTIGTTYYLRVYSATGAVGQFASFDLCIGSPPLKLDNTTYTVPQLVTEVLINSPCAQVSNITWKTGNTNNFGSTNGIAYFEENAPSTLPFSSGIVMTTGNALRVSGPNDVIMSDGNQAWTGDTELEAILAASGVTLNSRNASVIEFDFVPLIDQISFNFMFASEEYGTFQCTFSDSFAFILTNTVTNVSTNLAFVPGTTTPISVVTVRDNAFNAGCTSVNPQFFDVFNGAPNQATAVTNFQGQTVEFTAQSSVIPLTTYHIKMVIADNGDNAYDSGVFLKANSFNVGNIDLGDDFLEANGNALCDGDSYVIQSGLPTANYTFQWSDASGPIVGATGPNLTINQEGTYTIAAQYTGTTCAATDTITIEYYDPLTLGTPNNLIACNSSGFSTFDLTANTPVVLGLLDPTLFNVTYHTTQSDADNDTNPITNPATYSNVVQNTEPIFIRVESILEGCFETATFNLIIQDLAPQFTLTSDFDLCLNATSTITVTPSNFVDADVVYTWSLGTTTLPDTTSSISVNQAGTYTVVVDNNGCIGTMSTVVTELPLPVAPTVSTNSPICFGANAQFTVSGVPGTVVSYTLDSGAVATVTLDSSGIALIESSGSTSDVILSLTDINDGVCNLTLTDNYTVTIIAAPIAPSITSNSPICPGFDAQFTLAGVPNAVITYNLDGGTPQTITLDGSGSGLITQNGATSNVLLTVTEINDGTCSAVISTSSTVVLNSIPTITSLTSNNQICINTDAVFTITGSPNSTITYAINGGASQTIALDSSGIASITVNSATVSQSIVLSTISLNGCSNPALNNSSTVTVINLPPVDTRPNESVCVGSTYTLTALNSGNSYYTGPNGTGTLLNPGPITIDQTQTIYILASTGTGPNVCTSESSFVITAVDLPELTLSGGCQGTSYIISASVSGGLGVTYAWTGPSGVLTGQTGSSITVNQDGQYSCVATLSSGSSCSSEAEVFIANGTLCTIQKGISPNGDGKNENFDLKGLNVRLLSIYNRYGKKVYSLANYTDQWFGQTDRGDELPSGTYFYVIERDNVESKSGWIYINR